MKRSKLFRLILVLLGVWLALLSILYFSSNKYRDHLLLYLKSQLDKHLEAEIQIQKDNIRVSLFRNFPNASITLKRVLIKSSPELNASEFVFPGGDTLLYAEELSLIFNLRSILSKNYELKRIVVESGQLNILYDKEKNNNFKIIKSTEKEAKDSLTLNLSEIQLRKTRIDYIDLNSDIIIGAFTDKTVLSSKFSGKDFEFEITAGFSNARLFVDKVNYLEKTKLKAHLKIIRQGDIYTFSHGKLELFDADISLLGEYKSSNRNYSFTASVFQENFGKINFPGLNSRLQKLGLKAESGKLDFSLTASGVAGKSPTSLKADYNLSGGVIKTLIKGTKISDIFVLGKYNNGKYGKPVSSQIVIDSIFAVSSESIVHGTGSIVNLVKPRISLNVGGVLELAELMEVEALARRFTLSGILEGTLEARGSLSGFESFNSSDIKNLLLKGDLKLSDGYVKPLTSSLPAAQVSGTIKMSNTKEIFFEGIQLTTGKSDLLLSGKILNLPFFSGNRDILPTYSCVVNSKSLHIEDFLVSTGKKKSEQQQMVQLPDSLKVIASISIEQFHFGKFQASTVSGDLTYVPKTLSIQNFSMLSQGGEIHSEIVLKQNKQKLIADCQADMENVDIGDMFTAFHNFRQSVIEADNLDGILTGKAKVHAEWDVYLNPFMEKLAVNSELAIINGELIDYPPMMGLSKFIQVDELEHIKFEQLKTSIVIKDRKVFIPQTIIKTSAMSLEGAGEHSFDNAYEYRMQVQLSDILWKKAKKKGAESNEFGYVVDDGLGRTTLPLIITGKNTDFEVKYDKATASATFREKVKEEGSAWRELLGKEEKEEPITEEEIRLEWEDEGIDEKKEEKAKESNSKDKEEFIIEWEDD